MRMSSAVSGDGVSSPTTAADPDCSGSRWIVNFREWPLERAENYPGIIDIVRRKVKPFRDRNNRSNYRDFWWRYGEHRPGLYRAIEAFDYTLAIAQLSNTIAPARVPAKQVFDQQCIVFALDDFASLGILSSSIHSAWVVRYTSTMGAGAGTRYAPQDVFHTLPRPPQTTDLDVLARRLDTTRRVLMRSRAWGLTRTYKQNSRPRQP